MDKEYAGIIGVPDFFNASIKLALGDDSPVIADKLVRLMRQDNQLNVKKILIIARGVKCLHHSGVFSCISVVLSMLCPVMLINRTCRV